MTAEQTEQLEEVANYFDIPDDDPAQPQVGADETLEGGDDEHMDPQSQPEDKTDKEPDGDDQEDYDDYSFLYIEDPQKRKAIGKRLMEKSKREAEETKQRLLELERKLSDKESVERIAKDLGLSKEDSEEEIDDKIMRLAKEAGKKVDLNEYSTYAEKELAVLTLENTIFSKKQEQREQQQQEREIISEVTGAITGYAEHMKTQGNEEMAGVIDQCYNAALKSELVAIRSANPGIDARVAQNEAQRQLVGKALQLSKQQKTDPANVILQYGATILDELGVPSSQKPEKPAKQPPLIDRKAREDAMDTAGAAPVQSDRTGDARIEKVNKQYDEIRRLYGDKA